MTLPILAIQQQFDPRRIAGCNLWIDFSDRSTITLDANSLIQQINDKSASALHGEQTTAANRPSLSTLNGLTCGNWGTTTNSIAITNSTASLNLQSAMVVAQWDDANNPSAAGALFTGRSGPSFSDIPFGYGSTSWYTGATYGTNIWLNRTLTTTFLPAMRTSAAVVQGHATSSVSLAGYSIGQDRPPTVGGNRNWRGRICEVICYSRQITTDERNWLAYEVAKKWGIAP